MTYQRYRASILLEADGSIFENAFFNVITFYIRTNGAGTQLSGGHAPGQSAVR